MTTFALPLPTGLSWLVNGLSISMPLEIHTFKVDENLPEVAASILREAGFDAETVLSEGLGGSPDSTLAAFARKKGEHW
jgi:hypothetical protein